jgi:hypothetical protein
MEYKNRIDKSVQIISMYRKGYMPLLNNLYTGLSISCSRRGGVQKHAERSTSSDER